MIIIDVRLSMAYLLISVVIGNHLSCNIFILQSTLIVTPKYPLSSRIFTTFLKRINSLLIPQ